MKTKKLILTIVITIMTIQSYSQNLNELRVYYGISDSKLIWNKDLDGAGNYEITNINEFGIKYLRKIKNNFSIELGLEFLKLKEKTTSAPADYPITTYEDLEIISLPIYANYTFWKYLFVNGGIIIDFQTTDNLSDSQSGIGYSFGIGTKYEFDKFLIFINPNYKRHSFIPFEKEKYHQKLTEFGVQFGIGYKF